MSFRFPVRVAVGVVTSMVMRFLPSFGFILGFAQLHSALGQSSECVTSPVVPRRTACQRRGWSKSTLSPLANEQSQVLDTFEGLWGQLFLASGENPNRCSLR